MEQRTVAEWRKILKLSYKPKGISIIGIKTNETVLEIPEKIGEKEVYEIDCHAFRGCTSLTSITLPSTLQRIGYGAFFACSNLSKVIFKNENVTIESDVFRNCPALADENGYVIIKNVFYNYYGNELHVDIPEGVNELGQCAFISTPDVKSIRIPTTIKTLSDFIFSSRENLEDVYIPANVIRIGRKIFDHSDKAKIHAPVGSVAEAYAKENDIAFIPD